MRVPHPLPVFFTFLLALAIPASALRPGIPRVTWFTEHFSLTIDESKQDLLPKAAAIAEECWAKESKFFEFAPPGRIQIVLLDEQDYANGYAYSTQEWVVVYMHSAEHLLRGRTRWLQGVLAHEIGHVFTLRKMGEDSYFLGADLFHRWNGKGPSYFHESFDWRYGQVPPWLAEGLAQYAAGVCGYDTLDTHRQMVLRVAAGSGQLLSLAELKAFAWDGRRNEMIYTQGYALVTYFYKTYGPKAMNLYLDKAGRGGWRGAFKEAFGKDLADLYADWRKALEAGVHWEENADGGYVLPEPAGPWSVETFPTPLREGRFLYLSARDNDHGATDLWLGDAQGHASKLYQNVTSINADGDGKSAYFTATRYAFLQGEEVSDLYFYDGEEGSIAKLTSHGRMLRGCASAGIVYGLRNDLGRTSIVKIAKGEWTTIFTAPETFEITDLAPGRNPGSLTLGTTSGFGNDLRELELGSLELNPLAASPQEEVDPHWSGDTLYFSADYSGNFEAYALAGETIARLTQTQGGAFHPFPTSEDIWVSSYGPAGFRLARLQPPQSPPPFVIELPMSGWKIPALLESEPDSYDHSRLGLLGFNVFLGVERNAGYRDSSLDTAAGSVATVFSYKPGSRLVTGVGIFWHNPTGVMDAQANLGLSRPLDYDGPMHLDQSELETRIRAFLPEFVVGISYSGMDFPGARVNGTGFQYYQTAFGGHLGMELRLAEHWFLSGQSLMGEDFAYSGKDAEKTFDSDLKFGGYGQFAFADMQPGKDGIIKGLQVFVDAGKPPQLHKSVPDLALNAGISAYASLARTIYLNGNVFHSEEYSEGTKGWVYGSADAYCAVPLGLQLGTRGGAGLYLDKAYPILEYREMARIPISEATSTPWQPASAPRTLGPLPADYGFYPRIQGFSAMIDRQTSHEVGMGFSLRTVTFFPRPETWAAFLRFDATDWSREPAWTVSVSL